MLLNGKTYSYTGVINGVTQYTERSGGTVSSFSNLTATVTVGYGKRGQRQAARSKTLWKLPIPVIAAEASACACPEDVLSQVDVSIDVRSDAATTTAQLTDALARLRDLVLTQAFADSFIQHVQPNA